MLETKTIPTLLDKPAEIVAIHCFPEGATPAWHVQSLSLSMPVALDFDSELFRRFRIVSHVFPLNVVIDKHGKIAHIGAVLDDAITALHTAADAP